MPPVQLRSDLFMKFCSSGLLWSDQYPSLIENILKNKMTIELQLPGCTGPHTQLHLMQQLQQRIMGKGTSIRTLESVLMRLIESEHDEL